MLANKKLVNNIKFASFGADDAFFTGHFLVLHLSKSFKNNYFLIEVFSNFLEMLDCSYFLGWHAFSDFIVTTLVNLFLFYDI